MYQIYQILPGDSLDNIASKFNTSVDNLLNINGLDYEGQLTPGNYIVVPKRENGYFQIYIAKKGDNLYDISKRYGTDVVTIQLLNGLKDNEYIYPNQELLIPAPDTAIYMTSDESLESISEKTGLGIDELIEQNKQLNVSPDQIVVYKTPKNE